MVKNIRRMMRNKERLWMFRAKFVRLYEEFEAKIEELCHQYGVEIDFWYSPSKIPQPKFVLGRVGLSADTLYDEEEFSLQFSPKTGWEKKTKSTRERRKRARSQSDKLRS